MARLVAFGVVFESAITAMALESVRVGLVKNFHHGPLGLAKSAKELFPFCGSGLVGWMGVLGNAVHAPFNSVNGMAVIDKVVGLVDWPVEAGFCFWSAVAVVGEEELARNEAHFTRQRLVCV